MMQEIMQNKKKKGIFFLYTFLFIILISVFLLNGNVVMAVDSSNANLSNLGFTPDDFTGFRASIIEYDITVGEDVAEIEVYATAQDENAEVEGTGSYELSDGLNKIPVTVTAQDGTTKVYTLNITKPESTVAATNQVGNTVQNETVTGNTTENVTNTQGNATNHTTTVNKVAEAETETKTNPSQTQYIVVALVCSISLIAVICAIIAYQNRYVEDDDYEEYDYEEALNRFKPIEPKNTNPIEDIYEKKERRQDTKKVEELEEKKEEEPKKTEIVKEEKIGEEVKEETKEEQEKVKTPEEPKSRREEIIDEFMKGNIESKPTRRRGKGKHF